MGSAPLKDGISVIDGTAFGPELTLGEDIVEHDRAVVGSIEVAVDGSDLAHQWRARKGDLDHRFLVPQV